MTQRCRVCGCSNLSACPGQCWWVEDDLCSSCTVACVPSGEHIEPDEAEVIEAIWQVAVEDRSAGAGA